MNYYSRPKSKHRGAMADWVQAMKNRADHENDIQRALMLVEMEAEYDRLDEEAFPIARRELEKRMASLRVFGGRRYLDND